MYHLEYFYCIFSTHVCSTMCQTVHVATPFQYIQGLRIYTIHHFISVCAYFFKLQSIHLHTIWPLTACRYHKLVELNIMPNRRIYQGPHRVRVRVRVGDQIGSYMNTETSDTHHPISYVIYMNSLTMDYTAVNQCSPTLDT